MKILIHGRHFPVAMFRWFQWAFEDLGHEVFSVGPYSNGTIPWGNFYFPDHKFPPNYILPEFNVNVNDVLKKIPFKPDFIFQAADTIFMEGRPPIPNSFYATDPHAVDYASRKINADYFFNAQKCYSQPGEVWIPYAYDKYIHKWTKNNYPKYDIVFCGLQYFHRLNVLEAFKKAGMKVFNKLGVIYEDYVSAYNNGKIAFVYSSKKDLPARFWEGLAMRRLVLTNKVPDLQNLEFVENKDYITFNDVGEAVEKAQFYLKNERAAEYIADSGYRKVQKHTYQERVKKIISTIFK